MGREVDAVCAGDATIVLDCFAPRRRGPLPRGADRADVERAFPGWEITDDVCADTEPDALARAFAFDERFFRLRRVPALRPTRRAARSAARPAPARRPPRRAPRA